MAVLVFFLNRFNVGGAVSFHGWEIFPTDWLVGFALLLAWMQRARIAPSPHLRYRPSLFPFLAGWFLVTFVSTLLNLESDVSLGHRLAALCTVAYWTLPLFVIPALNLTKREVYVSIAVYACLGVLGGVLSCFQSLRIQEFSALIGWKYVYGITDSERRADLPLGVSTVIGVFFATVMPIGFALLVKRGRGGTRLLGLVTVLVVGMGSLFTASRAALIVLAFVCLACLLWMRTPGSSRLLPVAGLVGLALLLGFAVSKLNFERLSAIRDGSIGWRMRGVQAAYGMFLENPLIGKGCETHFRRQHGPVQGYFSTEKAHEAIYYKGTIAPSDPHNAYLLIAAESGLFGLVFYLLFLGRIGFWFYRYQSACEDPEERLWMRTFLIGLVAMLIHSVAGTDLVRQARMAPLFWIYCALGVSLGQAILRERFGTHQRGGFARSAEDGDGSVLIGKP
jgi:O-antigen ligase